ncbi:MAG: sugar ABC transporter ATP-binding protein [Aggregatilineales bacterium]
MSSDYFVETRGITKRFFAVQALDDVSVSVRRGAIHALVGENGAGKSTLGKVISGVIRPDAGELLIDGRQVQYPSPHEALLDGVTAITQEIALLNKQTVLYNVLLGLESGPAGILNRAAMLRRYEKIRVLTGFEIDPHVRVRTLRMADQKKVEVMQAIARNARLIVMDEPTAMLSDSETAAFLKIVRHLRDLGITIIYISHFLREVLELADEVTVMRNGQVVRTSPVGSETVESLVTAMLGKQVAQMYPPKRLPPEDAPVLFEVRGLCSSIFNGIDLHIRAGEILGLAGLVGAGRSRLARTLFGAEKITGGEIRVDDRPVTIHTVRDAMNAGIYLLPESRKAQGLLLKQTLQNNITLPHLEALTRFGIVKGGRERDTTLQLIRTLNVQPPFLRSRITNFSGGNQQKALFAKWLYRQPKIFIIDEPTRGIDVGAKQAIYELIAALAARGIAILLISSEIEEILGLAHRAIVMRYGAIAAEFYAADGSLTEDNIMRAAFGTHT